jgi:MFS family permease
MAGVPALPAPSSQIDKAWWVLLGAGVCMFCGQPAVILFTFGTFVPEIANATNWSRIELAAAIAPATVAASLLAPFVGRVADRVGTRRLVVIGGPAFALGFILMGYLAVSTFTFTALLTLTRDASALRQTRVRLVCAQAWFGFEPYLCLLVPRRRVLVALRNQIDQSVWLANGVCHDRCNGGRDHFSVGPPAAAGSAENGLG